MTFKEQFVEHLKANGFEVTEEKDGDDTLVALVDSESGKSTVTVCFDKLGNITDVWNSWKDRFDELKEEVEEQVKDAEFGKSVKVLLKTFKEL